MKLTKQILEAVNRGIQLALDDIEDNELNGSLSQQNDVINAKDVIKNRIELDKYTVDLGLHSGTRWAKYNLGVNPNKLSKPEDWYGDYYAWGETIPNKSNVYNQETYQFKNLIKYNKEDHLTELQFMDDPAYQNMHLYNFKFHMPTKEQFEELIEETNNEWVEDFNGSGVNGYKFTNKSDSSKYIFLPASGFYGIYHHSHLRTIGVEGYYWSSSLDNGDTDNAWSLYCNSERVEMYNGERCNGFSVRPVINLIN